MNQMQGSTFIIVPRCFVAKTVRSSFSKFLKFSYHSKNKPLQYRVNYFSARNVVYDHMMLARQWLSLNIISTDREQCLLLFGNNFR